MYLREALYSGLTRMTQSTCLTPRNHSDKARETSVCHCSNTHPGLKQHFTVYTTSILANTSIPLVLNREVGQQARQRFEYGRMTDGFSVSAE